jgi:WD40 repeat protein
VAGQETAAIAVGGGAGVTLRNAVSGAEAGPQMADPAGAVASVALPDGEAAVITTAGDDGSLRWWDAATGEPLDGMAAGGAAPALSLAPVLMPASPGRMHGPLAGLRGRAVLAVGDADGIVRLWDPVARVPLPLLFRRPGRRVVSLTAVNFANQPPWDGTYLFAVYGDLLVDIWQSASVRGRLSTMAPDHGKLAAAGHQHIIAAAVSPRRLGYRRPVLLADRNGTVSMWETFGVRLGDPLPPDPAHREVTAIAVLRGPGDGITVLTASRADSNLRAWQPLNGSATLMPLNVRPRCLLTADDTLIIGHDDGLLALFLTDGPR